MSAKIQASPFRRLGLAAGAALVGFSYSGDSAAAYLPGTVGHALFNCYGIDLTAEPFNADPSGVADCGPALTMAASMYPGVPVRLPAGSYRFTTKPNIKTPAPASGAFAPGFKLFGDGPLRTVVINDLGSDALFDLDTDVDHATVFKGHFGAVIHGMTITREAATVGGVAVRLRTAYSPTLAHLHIIGQSQDGVQIKCSVGDNDGSNMVNLYHVRIENCPGWGIDAASDPGFNETSFIKLEHCFIQACGTASGGYQPPSGGMRCKAQIVEIRQGAFTLNENCALWIPGEAGLAQNVTLEAVAFENNKARAVFSRGVKYFATRGCQLYQNNTYKGTFGVEFEAGSYVVDGVDMKGWVVRATAGASPFTAFKLSGQFANKSACRVVGTLWDNWTGASASQTKFDGWEFDHIPNGCDVTVLSGTTIALRPSSRGIGGTVPLRKGGAGGEWVSHRIGTSGGIAKDNTGLLASTTYNVYFYDNAGAPALSIETTAPVLDWESGYLVATGDAGKLWVGAVDTTGAGAFKTTASGYLTGLQVPGAQPGVYGTLWIANNGTVRVTYPGRVASDGGGVAVGAQT